MLNSDYAIKSYVSICNRALEENKNKFPFKQIMNAAQNIDDGKKVEVQIAGADAIDSYIFVLDKNHISVMPHSNCKNCQCDGQWHIEWQYLLEVLKHPDSYIKNPAKIDWSWIGASFN